MGNLLRTVPERHRWKVYVGAFALIAVMFVALLVIDVWRGGDAGAWIKYVVGILGLGGTGMALSNTDRTGV